MAVSRRQFLDICKNSAIALGISSLCLSNVEELLASPNAPTILWLEGTSCSGCSVSFLNRISTTSPKTAGEVLIQTVNLRYHPELMAAAGNTAVAVIADIVAKGNYILVVEGGVPTAFGGATCFVWSQNGNDITMLTAVQGLAKGAAAILCIGTCASFGGVAASNPNPTGVKAVSVVTGKPTVNISGCPPHPDWIVWTIAQLLGKQPLPLDQYSRPTALYGKTVHRQCPRRETEEADTYGQDNRCMEELGCLGPKTYAPCPVTLWNGGVNWCVDTNSQCIGCTQPNFPASPLRSGHGD
jgi:hydrogenase small subunit